jgi:HD-GYP domain-containing protein (c-di-GMP phosphodiesterase class II)
MQDKQIVISGLVITALVVAVALGGWLLDWATALLFMGAGVYLTYMVALTQRQRQDLSRWQALGRAWQDISKAESYGELAQYLELALYRVLAGKDLEVRVFHPTQFAHPEENISVWADLLAEAGEATDLVKKTEGKEEWFLLPIKASEDGAEKIIVGWKQALQPEGQQIDHKDDLGMITNAAARVLTRLSRRHDEEHFMNELLQTAVKAGEAEMFKGHGERVAVIADLLGRQLGLDEQEKRDLHYAALLHDIGRAKSADGADEDHPGQGVHAFPAGDEWNVMREAIKYHHERYDGSGFPEGKRMTEIPFFARIIAVADILDGLTALAPEEERLPLPIACQVIRKATGSSFDPLAVVALSEVQEELQDPLATLAPVASTNDLTGSDNQPAE